MVTKANMYTVYSTVYYANSRYTGLYYKVEQLLLHLRMYNNISGMYVNLQVTTVVL